MSKLLSILLILIISAQTVHQGLIYAYYVLNKDYIAQNLCENKRLPAIQCNGKCHLKTILQIEPQEGIPQPMPLPSLEEIKIPLLFYQALSYPLSWSIKRLSIGSLTEGFFNYCFWYTYKPIVTIFHPPQ